MGYVKEPNNIDLVVAPSVLTAENKRTIARAIAQYKKTGFKAVSEDIFTQGSAKIVKPIGLTKSEGIRSSRGRKKSAKI